MKDPIHEALEALEPFERLAKELPDKLPVPETEWTLALRRAAEAAQSLRVLGESGWQTVEAAPECKDILGLYLGGISRDIPTYHIVRQGPDCDWACEGFSIPAPHLWMSLPTYPAQSLRGRVEGVSEVTSRPLVSTENGD